MSKMVSLSQIFFPLGLILNDNFGTSSYFHVILDPDPEPTDQVIGYASES